MATRLEQIRQALILADKEGKTEDARVLAEAYRKEEAREAASMSVLQGEQLTPEQIKQRQSQAAKEGIAFREQQAADRETGIFENLAAGADVAATTMYQGAPVISAGINSAIVGESSDYTGFIEDIDQYGNRILLPQSKEDYDRIKAEREKLRAKYADQAAKAFQEGIVPIAEAQRQYQDVNERAGGWLSQTVGDVGASSPSFIPAVAGITTAAATGVLTRNPVQAAAAGKAAQVITSPIPAYQAAVNAYIQHKSKYPEAPESEHLAYATAQAGIELGSEMILPAAGAGKTLAGTVTKRVGSEVLSENISELGGNALDVVVAPELAPKSLDDVIEGHLRASSAALVGVAPVSVIGARDATLGENLWADLQSKKPPVAPPTPTGDPAIDAGQAAGEAIARSVAEDNVDITTPQGEVSQLPRTATTTPAIPVAEGVDLTTPVGESMDIATQQPVQYREPVGSFKRNLPMTWAPGVDLETAQGEATPLSQAGENLAPQEVAARAPIGPSTPVLESVKTQLEDTTRERIAVQQQLTQKMSRKERAPLNERATQLVAQENTLRARLEQLQPQAVTAVPPQIEQAASPAAPATKSVTFQTEKGSTYTVFEDGTTERDKAARSTPGHEGDSGKKRRTARTVYVDPTVAASLGKDHRAISWASLDADSVKQSQPRLVVDNDKGTITSISFQQGRYGSTESARDIPFSNTPGVGLVPVEVWGKDESQQFSKMEAYSGIHVGNKIVSVDGQAPTRAQRATTPAVQQPTQTTTTDNQQDIADAERVFTTTDPKRQELESKIAALANGTTRTDRVALENEVRANLVTQQAEAPNDKRSAVRNAVLNLARKVDNALAMLNVVKTIVNVQSKTKDKIADIPNGVDRIIASLESHPMLQGTKVIVGDDVDTLPTALAADIKKDGGDIAGAYLPSSDIIMLSGKIGTGMKKDLGGDVSTVLHEMLHGATERAFMLHDKGLLTDTELTGAISHFDTVREAFNKRFNLGQTEQGHSTRKLLTTGESHAIDYANKSRSEFLAVALTSPEFRSAAKKMNLLTKVKDAIRRLFRLPPTDQQILDDILDAGLRIVDLTRSGSEAIQSEFNSLKAQVNGGTVFSKETTPSFESDTQPITDTDAMRKAIINALDSWDGDKPVVEVFENREDARQRLGIKHDLKGKFGFIDNNGKVGIILSNNKDVKGVIRTLQHEVIGHYGVRRVLEDAWDGVVQGIVAIRNGVSKASPEWKAVIRETELRYPDFAAKDPLMFAHEVLAVAAENGVTGRLMGRVITKVRGFLRRFGLVGKGLSESEARDVLRRATKLVTGGDTITETPLKTREVSRSPVSKGTTPTTRSERVKLREQTVGKAKKVEPGTNALTQSDLYKTSKDFLSALLSPSGREGAEGKRAMQIAKGTQLEIDAVSKRLSNALKNELYHIKATDKELAVIDQLAKTYLSGYKAEDRKAAINDPRLPAKLKPVLESARKEMDDLSIRVAAQITDAYAGKDMPESVINTLETLTENLGKYISRSYEIDYVKGFGKKLWRDYKAGEAKAIERLQPLMNLISNQVATLPDSLNKLGRTDKGNLVWKEKGRGRETVRDYLSRMHTNLIGSPAGLSNNDMFEALNALAKSPKMKNIQEMTDTIVKSVIDYHDVDNDSQVKFFRGLRSDDRALRKRVRVPEEFRKAWGEVDDPAINVVITLSRQAAALANLRASAYWEQASPDLFTDAQSDETPVRVPNDPFIYGRLAGKYTTKGVLATIKAQAAPDTAIEVLNINNSVEFGRYLGGLIVRGFTKLSIVGKVASIILNLKNLAMNLTNFFYVPLANGNLTYAHMGKGAKVAAELVGTAYRTKGLSPETRELLDLGVIDPAQTQVDEEVRQLKKESQLRRSLLANPLTATGNQLNVFREAIAFLELTPKIANYFWNKEQLARLYPSLTESEIQEEAARLTNETNFTYSYTPKAARMAETVGLSYVSSFIAESFRTTYANIAVGTRMLKNGDTPAIKLAGAQRLAGQALSLSMASHAVPALVKSLYDSLLVLVGDDGEDEDKIFNALEYTESGDQRIVWNLRPDGSFDVFDLGMWSTYDVAYSPARAVADAMEAAYEGDYDRSLEDLQDALKSSIGSFFQGAPLSKLALRTIKGGDVETDAWLSTFIPGFAKSIGRSTDLPEDASPQEQIFAVLNMPREERSFLEDLRGTTTGNFNRAVTESKDKLLSTLEGVPDGIRFIQSMSNAVLGERSAQYVPYKEEELVDLWGEVQDDQREAFEKLMVKIEGARAINRMRGAPQDEGIQQALVEGGMSEEAAKQAVKNGTYTPSPLSDSWGQREIDRAVRKETTRAAKAALRETLEKRRLQIIRITGGTVDDT